jgi:pimeloyl-ACP methyl ester carboxylesterase
MKVRARFRIWRDFPVAKDTGSAVKVYSPYGRGNSDLLAGPRPVSYMRDEAVHALPDLLAQLPIEKPILLGHSDGASIALIYPGAQDRVCGLALLASHGFVEDLSVKNIARVKKSFESTELSPETGAPSTRCRVHVLGWNDVWLDPDLRRWNIEEYLPRMMCPILAVQGIGDEYGTMAQVQALKRQSSGSVEIVALAECRHSPQRDPTDAVLAAIAGLGNKSQAGGV